MDFTSLTNEQLLDLLQATLRETVNRNISDAAREVMLSEKERAEIAIKATEQAKKDFAQKEADRIAKEAREKVEQQETAKKSKEDQENIAKNWNKKREAAIMLEDFFTDKVVLGWYVNVWKSGTGEKRIYINDGEPFGRKTSEVACLYVTGSAKKAPGTFEIHPRFISEDKKQEFLAICQKISADWNLCKFKVGEALAYETN